MDVKTTLAPVDNSQRPVALIAGGAGFVGSFLCELLLLKNCRVVAVDNLTSGKKGNLEKCLDHPNFSFLQQDMTQPLNGLNRIDYIFHLAGLEPHLKSKGSLLEMIKANTLGTLSLLKMAAVNNAKFLLGSSLRLDDISLSKQELTKFFADSQISQRLGGNIEPKRFAEILTTEYYQEKKIDARIVRLGFLYGPRMNFDTGGEVAFLLKQALAKKKIKIPGSGQQKVYPTFISDVVYGLSKSMFSPGTSGKVLNLINTQEVTLLSFAQEIQRQMAKKKDIEFIAEDKFYHEIIRESGEISFIQPAEKTKKYLDWEPKIDFIEGITGTLAYFERKEIKDQKGVLNGFSLSPIKLKSRPRTPKETVTERLPGRGKTGFLTSPVTISVILLLLIIFHLPLLLFWNLAWGTSNLIKAKQAMEKGDYVKIINSSAVAGYNFNQADKRFAELDFLFDWLSLKEKGEEIERMIDVGRYLSSGVNQAGLALKSTAKLGQAIMQKQEIDIQKQISDLKIGFDQAYRDFAFAQAFSQTVRFDEIKKIPFNEAIKGLETASQVMAVLPDLIGLENRRDYLVLLQNNMEIRPTGGFIGSFALTAFENGKWLFFEVYDVYSADGQLKGHVEPPQPIKEQLGEAGWYLRDSNWHPDFPTSARAAEWFLDKEMGQKVDGVVGVNLYLAQAILKEIDGVDLVDFQEKIDENNLFEKATAYSEEDFFPGSKQKKDFLSALSRSIFEEIRQADEKTWFAVGKAVYQSIQEENLTVYLNDEKNMEKISQLGWDGRIKEINCRFTGEDCYLDYLMLVEANVGVNKANYYVKRNLSQQVKVSQSGVVYKNLQIHYLNRSQSENKPEGRYKNYLRILLPEGAKIESVAVDGQKLNKNRIDEKRIMGKSSFGFLVEVPIKGETLVEASFRLSRKMSLIKPVRYLLYVQKQPGTSDDSFNFWLTAPEGYVIDEASVYSSLGILKTEESVSTPGTFLINPPFKSSLVFEALLTD